jgi:hypothetical protein
LIWRKGARVGLSLHGSLLGEEGARLVSQPGVEDVVVKALVAATEARATAIRAEVLAAAR